MPLRALQRSQRSLLASLTCLSPAPTRALSRALQLMLALAALSGCEESADSAPSREAPVDVDSNTDAGLPERGADAATDAEVDAELDIGPPRPLLEPEFVMDSVQLLPSGEGFDLNGRGRPSNGLALLFEDELVGGALGGDPNNYIARSVRRGELLLLLDFSRFNDFVDDDSLDIDIFLGRDPDGERRNNFDGDDFTVTCSSLTAEGTPDSRFIGAQLSGGALSGEEGEFRFLISFAGDTEVVLQRAKIKGSFSADGERIEAGMLGGAVSYSDLELVVYNDPEIGSRFAEIMLAFLQRRLDVDLDGDTFPDALSASFSFTAVRAIIDRESPCVE